MSAENFRSLENQPANRGTIKRLYSLLETICEIPPKSIDVDETAAMYAQLGNHEQLRGTQAFYAIKGDEMRESQRMHIALAPKQLHPLFEQNSIPIGYLVSFQHEAIDDHSELVQTKYRIYGDRVSKHRIFPEQASEDSGESVVEQVMKQAKKEKTDERYGLTLMTESEVMHLNADLGALIEDEK
jgi:hypothetical protein